MANPHHDSISSIIDAVLPTAVADRHHIHRNPELSHGEIETSAYVAERLRTIGVDSIQTGVGGHGIVAELRGTKPGRTFAIRADMDALPIEEESDLPYRSCRPGVMHACGHDGHAATLLGTVATLAQLRNELKGSVRFLFQPAEETVGGAARMCADGAIDGVDGIVALHGWPGLEVGRIGVRSGPMMASADSFDIRIFGRQAHAAMPHLAIDPIVVGSHIVVALQTIASREFAPIDSVVVTVGMFRAGTAHNIIPAVADLRGTFRCLTPEHRALMPGRIERIANGVCQAFGARCEIAFGQGTPVTINDPAFTELVAEVAAEQLGPDNVVTLESPSLGAEDFGVFLTHVPGMMFRLGVGANSPNLHTPTYNFPDEALPVGIELFSRIALRFLLSGVETPL